MAMTMSEGLKMHKEVQAAMRGAEEQLPLLAVQQPAALVAVYAGLDDGVVATCEQARRGMREGFLAALKQAREALAPSGRFKEWCEAAGINYHTAKSRLARAEPRAAPPASAPNEEAKQAGEYETHTRSAASTTPTKRGAQLALVCADDEERQLLVSRLRKVQGSAQLPDDKWAATVMFLLDFWQQHREENQAA